MADLFVAPRNSSDQNEGTIDSPLATLGEAAARVKAGDTIYMRGGVYTLEENSVIGLEENGTKDKPIRLLAYQNESPVLDASQKKASDDVPAVIYHSGDYWQVKGIEVKGGPYIGYSLNSANNNILEDLNIHDNGNTGLSLYGGGSNNTVLGGDFHHNFDRANNGEDADGIGVKFGSGEGNVIDGARVYNNSDDGIDLWDFKSSITIENTWAYGNGVDRWNVGEAFTGNGDGFKLSGGRGEDAAIKLNDLAHVVRNNLAWDNGRRGFDHNGSMGRMIVENNTSYNNGVDFKGDNRTGFDFLFNSGSHKLRNNLSYNTKFENTISLGDEVLSDRNSWELAEVTVDQDDFLSLDDTIATGARAADGSLPQSNFLKLKEGSDLIDAGKTTGADFLGSAPDLGAYEFEGEPVAASRPTDIVVDYDFEIVDGDVVFDEVARGGNNAGRLYGAEYEEEYGNRVVSFDGDDRLAVPNSKEINQGIHQQRTVSFWFKPDDLTLDTRKQVLYEEGGGDRGLNTYIDQDRLYVGGWNRPEKESGWTGTWLETGQIEAGKWQHLAIVLEGGEGISSNALTGYLNGEAFDSGEGSQLWGHDNNIGIGNVNQSTLFHDGGGYGNQGFIGSIDSFKLFNSAATAEQLQALIA